MVREQVSKVLAELDIATLQDLRRLEVRVAALEQAQHRESAPPAPSVEGDTETAAPPVDPASSDRPTP
ncbi:hypothetical protein D3C73_1334890 [compost metagenome]